MLQYVVPGGYPKPNFCLKVPVKISANAAASCTDAFTVFNLEPPIRFLGSNRVWKKTWWTCPREEQHRQRWRKQESFLAVFPPCYCFFFFRVQNLCCFLRGKNLKMEAFQSFCEMLFCVVSHPVLVSWERKGSTWRRNRFFVQSMLVFWKGTMLKVRNVSGWRYGWKVCIPKQKQVA